MKAINWDNVKSAREEIIAAGVKRQVTDHRAAAEAVARNLYSWPGGYEMVAVTDDGAALCGLCVRDNFRACYTATPGGGWKIVAVGAAAGPADETGAVVMDCEDACGHCGRNLGELF